MQLRSISCNPSALSCRMTSAVGAADSVRSNCPSGRRRTPAGTRRGSRRHRDTRTPRSSSTSIVASMSSTNSAKCWPTGATKSGASIRCSCCSPSAEPRTSEVERRPGQRLEFEHVAVEPDRLVGIGDVDRNVVHPLERTAPDPSTSRRMRSHACGRDRLGQRVARRAAGRVDGDHAWSAGRCLDRDRTAGRSRPWPAAAGCESTKHVSATGGPTRLAISAVTSQMRSRSLQSRLDAIADLERCRRLGRLAVDLDVAAPARGRGVAARLGEPHRPQPLINPNRFDRPSLPIRRPRHTARDGRAAGRRERGRGAVRRGRDRCAASFAASAARDISQRCRSRPPRPLVAIDRGVVFLRESSDGDSEATGRRRRRGHRTGQLGRR